MEKKNPHDPVKSFQPPANILCLDDGTLLHIMSYLPFFSLIELRFVSTRFVPLFRKALADIGYDRLFADTKFVTSYPPRTCEHVYKALAEVVPHLHLYQIKEVDAVKILSCFTQIDELDITVSNLRDVGAIARFPAVRKLYVVSENTKRPYLNSLMKKLGPTLEVLVCSEAPNLEIYLAPTVKELCIDHKWLGIKRAEIAWRNNTTLASLIITGQKYMNMMDILHPTEMHRDFRIVRDNWKLIADIPSLKKLDWRAIGGMNLRANVLPRFNNVTTVSLEFYGEPLVLPVLSAFGEQLTDLKVTAELTTHRVSVDAIGIIGRRYPNLEKLFYGSTGLFKFTELNPLQNLMKLHYLEVKIDHPNYYLGVFKMIPSLTLLRDNGIWKKEQLRIPRVFEEWARQQDRDVKVENRTYDPRDKDFEKLALGGNVQFVPIFI